MNLNLNPNSGQIGVWVGDELEYGLKVKLVNFEIIYVSELSEKSQPILRLAEKT